MNNTYEKLKPYRKNPVVFTILIVLYVLAIGLSIFGLIALNKDYTKDAAKFYSLQPETEKNYYIDALRCTGWVCVYDGQVFYVVNDADYSNIVAMTKEQFEKLDEQYEYSLHHDEPGYTAPEPYRIYGQAKRIPDKVVTYFMEVFDISKTEVYAYLGTYYLDTYTVSRTGDYIIRSLCFLIPFFVFSFIGFITARCNGLRNSNKTFNRLLDLNEADKAASELSEPTNKIFSQGDYIFSQNYIFSKKFANITRYDDILWIYGVKHKGSNSTVLVAATKLKIKYNIIVAYGGCKEILDIIKEKNPEVRIGLNDENKTFYKNYLKFN